MKRSFIVLVLLASMVAAGLPPAALAQGGPVYIATASLPLSERTKFPHIATLGSEVLVAGNAERSEVRLWRKADTAATFANPITIGPAEAVPDYTTPSIFTSSTGAVYYAWIHERERRIYLRVKPAGAADFGPRVLAYGAGIPYEVEVAANEDGVFLFWREDGTPIKYRRSTDGASWAVPVQTLGAVKAEPLIDVAAGAGRRLAVAYTRERAENSRNYQQGYLAIWDGSAFVYERIPAVPDREFANPSVALMPDGGYTTTMRSLVQESGLGAGIYVADRSAAGTWSSVARLARGDTLSTSVDVDSLGNAHIFWISRESGTADLYYTFRRAGEGYGGSPPAGSAASPLRVAMGNSFITNVRSAVNLRDQSYGHAITERFDGGPSSGQYFLFGLPVNVVGATGISIEGGAALTSKAAVNVTFSGLTGTPSEVRWAWGAPPASNVAFSSFNPASPTISVPVPALGSGCAALTLYTQLKAGTAVQQTPNSDAIVVDQAVQAEFFVTGPEPALDPDYTSSLSATVFVFSGADCAGIATASVSGPIAGGTLNLPVAGTRLYGQSVTLTGDPGVKELAFLATDLAGNAIATPVTKTIVYDPAAPDLRGIGAETEATLVPNPRGTTQLRLALDNFDAVDAGGVVAGIQVVVTGPPVEGVPSVSDPLIFAFDEMEQVVANPDGTFNLRETLSLTDFFAPAELVPGLYSFEIRAVDAAGNVSATGLTVSETLVTITFPAWVPFVRR